jgi:hypothetical protein
MNEIQKMIINNIVHETGTPHQTLIERALDPAQGVPTFEELSFDQAARVIKCWHHRLEGAKKGA